MPDLINKLSTYAALVGVIGAIGGGFYAWGEFNTRLSVLEEITYETVDLSGINDDIAELHEKINERINSLGGGLEKEIDETLAATRSLAASLEVVKGEVNASLEVVKGEVNASLEEVKGEVNASLEEVKGDTRINAKAIEFNGIMIEEAIAKSANPLAN